MEYIAEELRPMARPVSELSEDPKNVRVHNDHSMRAVKASLERFGFRSPLCVKDGVVIAGNARLRAAKELGWDHVPVVDVSSDSDVEATLFAIQDNYSHDASSFDQEELSELLGSLQTEIELEEIQSLGWTDAELQELGLLDPLEEDSPGDRPEAPLADPPPDPITQPGDLIILGEHRLLCGDSTDEECTTKALGGKLAEACLTDPPYGTASESRVQLRGKLTPGQVDTFDIEWDRETPQGWVKLAAKALQPGAAVISFYNVSRVSDLWDRFDAAGIHPLHICCWHKPVAPTPRQNFCSCIELAVFGRVRGGKVICWNGGGATSNVFYFPRSGGHERITEGHKPVHPTQKPLKLWITLLQLITQPGHIVFDPFLGSGTSVIAAERIGRVCYGIEKDPAYCDVIVDRWEKETGKRAVRP